MSLINWKIVVFNSVGAGGGGLYKPAHPAKSSDTGCSVLPVEANHINGGIKLLSLHLLFKVCVVMPIALNETNTIWYFNSLAAVEAHNFMPLLEQTPDNGLADISCSTNDADFHNLESTGT